MMMMMKVPFQKALVARSTTIFLTVIPRTQDRQSGVRQIYVPNDVLIKYDHEMSTE